MIPLISGRGERDHERIGWSCVEESESAGWHLVARGGRSGTGNTAQSAQGDTSVLLNRAVLYGSLTAMLAAAASWPLRVRVQQRLGHLFNVNRNAPYKGFSWLGRLVQDANTVSALKPVVPVIADGLRLEYGAVETRPSDGWGGVAVYDCGSGGSSPRAFSPVSQPETGWRLLVGTRLPGERLDVEEELILADLARQPGPRIYVGALRQALEESRARLVTIRGEERRRLRRDLHDGLGPTLASLTLGLDMALTRCDGRPDLQDSLERLKAQMQRAVAEVRCVVYGLRPPALDELGLAESLREDVERLRGTIPMLSVNLEVSHDRLLDLPAAVEVACYLIATEALTNMVRHASAATCTVRLWRDEDMHVLVQDDGVGLRDGWRAGVGIASMRERVAELDGDLVIEPCLPRGTMIAAHLPLGRSA